MLLYKKNLVMAKGLAFRLSARDFLTKVIEIYKS